MWGVLGLYKIERLTFGECKIKDAENHPFIIPELRKTLATK